MKAKNLMCCVMVLAVSMVASAAFVNQPLVNAGFENGDLSGYNPQDSGTVVMDAGLAYEGDYYCSFHNEGAATMKGYVDQYPIGGDWNNGIVNPGDIVELSFMVYNPSSDPMTAGQHIASQILWYDYAGGGGSYAATPMYVMPGDIPLDTWTKVTQTATLQAGATAPSWLKFQILYNDYNQGMSLDDPGTQYIDDIQMRIDFIPEPATMALLGLGGIALLRKKRS